MPCMPVFWKNNNFDFFDPNLPKNKFWGRNLKSLSPDSEFAIPRYHVWQFSVKTNNFDFFDLNLPKKEIRIWNSENKCWNKKQQPRDNVHQFSGKTNNFDYFGPNFPKDGFRIGNSETNVGIRINIVEMPCMPLFRKNEQLWLFQPKFAQKWILGSGFQKCKSGFRICVSKITFVPIFN